MGQIPVLKERFEKRLQIDLFMGQPEVRSTADITDERMLGAGSPKSGVAHRGCRLWMALLEGCQESPQTYFLVLEAKLRPDIVPVEVDRALLHVHGCRDLLCGLSLEHKI